MPEKNDTVGICLIKRDDHSPYPPEVSVLTVPESLIGPGGDTTDVYDLIMHISRDWIASGNAGMSEKDFCFSDFLNIPAGFLKKYRIGIRPADTKPVMEIVTDHSVFEP